VKDASLAKGGIDPVEVDGEKEWEEVKARANWVEDETAIFSFANSAKNIAHYAGVILFYQHIKSQPQAYLLPPDARPPKLFIVSPSDIVRLLANPITWHGGLLSTITANATHPIPPPATHSDHMLDAVLDPETRVVVGSVMDLGYAESRAKPTCFRTAIYPAFLKSRYFVTDEEVPGAMVRQTPRKGGVKLPSDAVKMRRALNGFLTDRKSAGEVEMAKRIVYFARRGRRCFNAETDEKLEGILANTASKHGMELSTVFFDKKTFKEQVESVWDATVGIGLHGANLVNTMFMPSSASLIEIMPYGFSHDMYVGGSGSGLYYLRHDITEVEEYPGKKPGQPIKECIRGSNECKVFYRGDYRKLVMNGEDLKGIQTLLDDAANVALGAR